MKSLTLNEGAQRRFVNNDSRYSAYIGGVGSGKTFAGIARGLKFSQQPKVGAYGPRGLVGAESYPVLRDVVLPQFMEMVDGSGLLKNYVRSEKKAILRNNAEILFRSLDDPDARRGVELSWFHIDEGRNISRAAWDVLIGRLRQPGYAHAGWVTSTPNGYDWMWEIFHPDSPKQFEGATWFGAATYENRNHLPAEYIRDLEANYEGRFFEQEVLGKFVGIVSGAVFPFWDSARFTVPVGYDPSLPLYSFWDFGVGDLGVCEFAQIAHEEKTLPDKSKEWVPTLRFIGCIEHEDWGAAEWAEAFHDYCITRFDGRRPNKNIGDPAGRQRSQATGTSTIDALAGQGVHIIPAPKKPIDHAILILSNLMAGGRVVVDQDHCARLAAAFSTHKWPQDSAGNRTGTKPVHDWTSHFCDAARYGATVLLSHFPKRSSPPAAEAAGPGTIDHIMQQILRKPEQWLGPQSPRRIEWQPGSIGA